MLQLPVFQEYSSERHCVHFSGDPVGIEPLLPKAVTP